MNGGLGGTNLKGLRRTAKAFPVIAARGLGAASRRTSAGPFGLRVNLFHDSSYPAIFEKEKASP